MAKGKTPPTGPVVYGFISPEGIGYPIQDGNYHAQWIFDNYDFIKKRYPDFPEPDKLKYMMVEDVRYELVRRGWIGVGMDWIVYIANLRKDKRQLIDAILMGVVNLPYKTKPVRVLDYSRDAMKTNPYNYDELEELEYYGSIQMPILYKIADVTQGSGFWITPNNDMHSIKGSHIEWIKNNVDILKKYFDVADTKDPGMLFMLAFQNGFVRFRTEYDDNDDPNFPDGKIISSISASDIGRIKSLPSMAKSMIAYSNQIDFYDMSNNAQMTVIPEEEVSKYTEYSSPDKRLKSNLKILLKLAKLKNEDEQPISAPKSEEIVDKGWISPDGKTYNTFHAFHAGWIAEHFDWLNDRVPLGNKQEVVRKSNEPYGAYHLRQLLIKAGWVAAYDAFRTINFFSNGDSRSLRNIEEAILLRQVPQKDFYSVQNINNDKLDTYTIEEIKESGMNKMASKTPEWVSGKPPIPGAITGDKGWISPEGETYVVNTTFHAGFIAQHFDWFKNKHHLDYSKEDVKAGSEEGGMAATLRNDIVRLGWVMVHKEWSGKFSFYTNGSSRSLENIQDAILLRKIQGLGSRIMVYDVQKNESIDYSTSQIMEEGLVVAKNLKNIKISQLDIRPAGCDYISLELDLIHKQHQQEDKDLLKFFFILDYILKKSDIDANVHAKVLEKYKELKDTIEFDAYSQEWLDKLSHIDTSEINNILALIS